MNKLVIIHFQPLENYPPVMNVINELKILDSIDLNVFSINNNAVNWFNPSNAKIFRLATNSKNSLKRYWGYLKFNLIAFVLLLKLKPKKIIIYETLSVLPAYFYKLIFRKTIVHIHFHEYLSNYELINYSVYFKLLNYIEKKLYYFCNSLSQTNIDRVKLFLNDNSGLILSPVYDIPNLPPINWLSNNSKLEMNNNNSRKGNVIKLVHIGALSTDSMYLADLINWIIDQNGAYSIDFYTNNLSQEAELLITSQNYNFIKLHNSINYFSIPQLLVNFDVGLTIYNGHIPNYTYNVPNKVYEYLYCGLDVWFSKDLLSINNVEYFNPLNDNKVLRPEFLNVIKWEKELVYSISQHYLSIYNLLR